MNPNEAPRLSRVLVALLKGIVYRDVDESLWGDLCRLQAALRDYFTPLGLELVTDEAEGYAWLRNRASAEGEEELPRLVARRPLSFPVSLLLALLRKKLAEHDASGGGRLILSRDEIVEMLRVFLPESVNEARITDQIEAHLNRIVEMGFVRRLRVQEASFEVRRILKAFVDAHWLADFDEKLAAYRRHVEGGWGQEQNE